MNGYPQMVESRIKEDGFRIEKQIWAGERYLKLKIEESFPESGSRSIAEEGSCVIRKQLRRKKKKNLPFKVRRKKGKGQSC